jgi:phenylacetate-CoA ligase
MHPLLARRVVFPLQERLKGKNTYEVLAALENSQWSSGHELEALQFNRLKQHIDLAYRDVPYYRQALDELGLMPDRIKDWADFRRFPFLTREIVRDQFDRLVSQRGLRGVQKMSTGGSTGSPVAILVDAVRNTFIDAARLRAHRWFDADMGVREIVLWGSPIEITRQDYLRLVRDRLLNSWLLSAFNLGEQKLAEYVEVIVRYRPVKMYGYASALYLLARYFQRTGRKAPESLKVVFATAEPLFDFQRQTIEQVFGIKVAVEYGARDAGLMANECPQGGLHIPVEGMIVEIDRPDSSGLGEVVVTNLFSRAMPIIRYRTGDMARWGFQPCGCGRGLPLLQAVEGRQTDFIITPDQRVIHALAVIYILRESPDIQKFQVIQETVDSLTVKVVPKRDLPRPAREKIIRGLQQAVGVLMKIDVVVAADIPITASGKFRYVISRVAASHLDLSKPFP